MQQSNLGCLRPSSTSTVRCMTGTSPSKAHTRPCSTPSSRSGTPGMAHRGTLKAQVCYDLHDLDVRRQGASSRLELSGAMRLLKLSKLTSATYNILSFLLLLPDRTRGYCQLWVLFPKHVIFLIFFCSKFSTLIFHMVMCRCSIITLMCDRQLLDRMPERTKSLL